MLSKHAIIYLLHILIVAPIIIYIGACQSFAKCFVGNWAYSALLMIGILAIGWHILLWIRNKKLGILKKYMWIHIYHIFFAGLLLLYVGYCKSMGSCSVPVWIYYLLFVLGIAVLGWHGYMAIKDIRSGLFFLK